VVRKNLAELPESERFTAQQHLEIAQADCTAARTSWALVANES
jgi:hypothetical protein